MCCSGSPRAVGDAESLQKLLFAEAIGVPMNISVLRDGHLTDVSAVPGEMADWGWVQEPDTNYGVRRKCAGHP